MMKEVPGLLVICISDRDGVSIIKSCLKQVDKNMDNMLKPCLLAASSSCTGDQANKLGIGICSSVVCQYDNFQVVSFNRPPFLVSMIANKDTCTGLLLGLQT